MKCKGLMLGMLNLSLYAMQDEKETPTPFVIVHKHGQEVVYDDESDNEPNKEIDDSDDSAPVSSQLSHRSSPAYVHYCTNPVIIQSDPMAAREVSWHEKIKRALCCKRRK